MWGSGGAKALGGVPGAALLQAEAQRYDCTLGQKTALLPLALEGAKPRTARFYGAHVVWSATIHMPQRRTRQGPHKTCRPRVIMLHAVRRVDVEGAPEPNPPCQPPETALITNSNGACIVVFGAGSLGNSSTLLTQKRGYPPWSGRRQPRFWRPARHHDGDRWDQPSGASRSAPTSKTNRDIMLSNHMYSPALCIKVQSALANLVAYCYNHSNALISNSVPALVVS